MIPHIGALDFLRLFQQKTSSVDLFTKITRSLAVDLFNEDTHPLPNPQEFCDQFDQRKLD